MIPLLVTLLVGLVIICLLWWATTSIMGAFNLDARIQTIIKVIFVVFVVLWLLSMIGGPIVFPHR